MRKTLVSLSIALAFTAGSAMADQATLDALQTAGIPMTTEQADAILDAECEQKVDAEGKLQVAHCQQLIDAVTAVAEANPALADAIYAAAATNPALTRAAFTAAGRSIIIPTNSIPSSSGAGGNNTASPN